MQTEYTDVVLFFEDHQVSKTMLLPEFEAILDHVVTVPECEEQNAQLAYVRVDQHLDIRAIVLFKLQFDSRGSADPKWNLPLDHMASNASAGPDLGGGRIRLACYSQCPIPWHQKQLWDPVMAPANNSFAQIRERIAENSLQLPRVPKPAAPKNREADPPALSMDQAVPSKRSVAAARQAAGQPRRRRNDAQRDRIAQMVKSQRLHIATLKNKRKEDAAKLKAEFRKRVAQFEKQFAELKGELGEQQNRASRYKALLEEQVNSIRHERERYAAQLQEVRSTQDSSDQLEELQQKYELELTARVEAETAELKEMLEMRNVELFYREEQMTTLRDEIANLRKEKVRLLNQNANTYLEQLAEAGVDFVAHHPGAGHLSIPLADVGRYLDDPQGFAAKKCYVDVTLYQQWLEHYNDPVCQAHVELDGESFPCGRHVDRVDIPNQFVATFSDRCPEHQRQSSLVDSQATNDATGSEQLRSGT